MPDQDWTIVVSKSKTKKDKKDADTRRKDKARRKLGKLRGSVAAPSRLVGPEDLKVGMHVIVSRVTSEAVWLTDDPAGGERLARETYESFPWCTFVYRITAVSLPYVLAVDTEGDPATLDVRRHRLARVANSFGKLAFRQQRLSERAK